jgi:hypothetical protein
MPLCDKCRKFYPPGFVAKVEEKTKLCMFCEKGVEEIRYGENNEKVAKRADIVLEYQKYMRLIREDNDNIKKLKRGKLEIPDQFRKE